MVGIVKRDVVEAGRERYSSSDVCINESQVWEVFNWIRYVAYIAHYKVQFRERVKLGYCSSILIWRICTVKEMLRGGSTWMCCLWPKENPKRVSNISLATWRIFKAQRIMHREYQRCAIPWKTLEPLVSKRQNQADGLNFNCSKGVCGPNIPYTLKFIQKGVL